MLIPKHNVVQIKIMVLQISNCVTSVTSMVNKIKIIVPSMLLRREISPSSLMDSNSLHSLDINALVYKAEWNQTRRLAPLCHLYYHVQQSVVRSNTKTKKEMIALVILLILCRILYKKLIQKNNVESWLKVERSEKNKVVILFVIAHPDDECMFFGPLIMNLAPCSKIHLLCLSSGNAEGLGKQREKELLQSAISLNLDPQNVKVVDDPAIPDGMDQKWDPELIVKHVSSYCKERKIQRVSLYSFNLVRIKL